MYNGRSDAIIVWKSFSKDSEDFVENIQQQVSPYFDYLLLTFKLDVDRWHRYNLNPNTTVEEELQRADIFLVVHSSDSDADEDFQRELNYINIMGECKSTVTIIHVDHNSDSNIDYSGWKCRQFFFRRSQIEEIAWALRQEIREQMVLNYSGSGVPKTIVRKAISLRNNEGLSSIISELRELHSSYKGRALKLSVFTTTLAVTLLLTAFYAYGIEDNYNHPSWAQNLAEVITLFSPYVFLVLSWWYYKHVFEADM